MPHRAKNKHRARHHTHTMKAASLSKPALPLPVAPDSEVGVVETGKKPTGASAEAASAASK